MIYEYWLAGIKEITDLKKQKLREVYGSGKAIYYIEETKLDKLLFKDVSGKTEIYYRSSVCIICTRTTSG